LANAHPRSAQDPQPNRKGTLPRHRRPSQERFSGDGCFRHCPYDDSFPIAIYLNRDGQFFPMAFLLPQSFFLFIPRKDQFRSISCITYRHEFQESSFSISFMGKDSLQGLINERNIPWQVKAKQLAHDIQNNRPVVRKKQGFPPSTWTTPQ